MKRKSKAYRAAKLNREKFQRDKVLSALRAAGSDQTKLQGWFKYYGDRRLKKIFKYHYDSLPQVVKNMVQAIKEGKTEEEYNATANQSGS